MPGAQIFAKDVPLAKQILIYKQWAADVRETICEARAEKKDAKFVREQVHAKEERLFALNDIGILHLSEIAQHAVTGRIGR